MNRLQQLFHAARNDDRPDCYNRVRYIREACKTFSDLCKNDKDLLGRTIDADFSKSFREFRSSEVGKDYRMVESIGSTGVGASLSILNGVIDELIELHEFVDGRRRASSESIKKLVELAREKQSNIRQTINDLRDNYEKAERKLEIADLNLKKFQTRSDRLSINNYDEKCRELEETRFECELNRTLTRDQYQSEIYQCANDEYSISLQIFGQYLNEQNQFYQDVSKYFSSKMPSIESQFNDYEFIPIFGCDLIRHCSKRSGTKLAYPLEICLGLLDNQLREEGIFRIASSQSKQKKFVNELNLQLIDKTTSLDELSYDAHVAANTLKQYLRELPNCLLTNELYSAWNQVPQIGDEQVRLQRVEQLLNQLPDIHYENLRYLVRFLSRLSKHSNENKMTVNNLSICIGSTILFAKEQQKLPMNQTSLSSNYTNGSIVLEFLITNHEVLFRSSTESNSVNQPDLIPAEFHSIRSQKLRSNPPPVNENNSDIAPPGTSIVQSSPMTRRKAKAPPPPPTPTVVAERVKEVDEPVQTVRVEQATGVSSLQTSLNLNERLHRRTISSAAGFDRPSGPPPLPPSLSTTNSTSDVRSENNHRIYENLCFPSDEGSTISNESFNVGKVIAQFNNRTSSSLNSSTVKRQSSSINRSNQNSPPETTDF